VKLGVGNYALGIGIILIPFFNFLSSNNLKELDALHIKYSSLSLIPFVLGALVLSWGISRSLTRRVQIKTGTLFPLICVGFYLQFYYLPLNEEFQRRFDFALNGVVALLLLVSIWLGIIVLGSKYPSFTKKALMVFTSLFLLITIAPSLRHFTTKVMTENITHKEAMVSTDTANMDLYANPSSDNVQSSMVFKSYPNVYFVILDGMMSLEHASELEIIKPERELIRLKKLGLTYIEKSRSAYNRTDLTLASVFWLDYPHTPTSHPYFDVTRFFPGMLFKEARKGMFEEPSLPLLYALRQNKIRFIWEGNIGFQCHHFNSFRWSCGSVDAKESSRSRTRLGEYANFVTPFYMLSIVGEFLDYLVFNSQAFSNTVNYEPRVLDRHSLMKFIDNFYEITSLVSEDAELSPHLNGKYFSFIHHFSPHDPHDVTETCDGLSEPFKPTHLIGYRASYRCALQEIEKFVEKINIVDPDSIIVIQGDHGWGGAREIKPITFTEAGFSFEAGIFNAIKAPEACFERYGMPQTTVNSIRFVLNCAYRFKFPYEDNIHYRAYSNPENPKYGTVERYDG
jgi:hypothetical protein